MQWTAQETMPLRHFLREKMALSGKKVEALLQKSGVRLNSKIERFGSLIVKRGDLIEVTLAESFPIQILFEDASLLVIEKPPFISCDETLIQALKQKLFLVHRLDKQTSGLLILAKTAQAKAHLEDQFRKKTIEKTYLALAEGSLGESQGTIECFLETKKRFQGGLLIGPALKGQWAVTHFKVVKKNRSFTFLELLLETGRTHQIRVHLQMKGTPVMGDPLYGKKGGYKTAHLMLHAARVIFSHPLTEERLSFTSSLPSYFQEALDKVFV